jgi:hypothetical protein
MLVVSVIFISLFIASFLCFCSSGLVVDTINHKNDCYFIPLCTYTDLCMYFIFRGICILSVTSDLYDLLSVYSWEHFYTRR